MDGTRAGRLLVVEDEHLLRSLTAQFLRGERYEVVEAADGAEGIGFFSSLGPFDLVLLDLNLPLIPGVEVCRRIRSREPAQPVIICSAAILEDHVAELRDLKVEQFLSKPYHPAQLLRQVAAVIASNRRARTSAAVLPERAAIWRADCPHSQFPPSHSLVKSRLLD